MAESATLVTRYAGRDVTIEIASPVFRPFGGAAEPERAVPRQPVDPGKTSRRRAQR